MEKILYTRGRHLNQVAWLYDPLIEKCSFGRERVFREKTMHHMSLSPTDRILDVGCGTGNLTLLVAGNLVSPGSITGIDAAPRMIHIARKKAEQRAVQAEFRTGVSEALDFPDDYFDIVVNSMFTHHIDTELKRISFAEMYRVLKPGGRAVTADIDVPTKFISKVIGWGSRYLLFQKEIEDNLLGHLPGIMAGAGFEDIRKTEHIYGLVSFFICNKPGGNAR